MCEVIHKAKQVWSPFYPTDKGGFQNYVLVQLHYSSGNIPGHESGYKVITQVCSYTSIITYFFHHSFKGKMVSLFKPKRQRWKISSLYRQLLWEDMTHQMARCECTLGFRALATAASPQPVHCSTCLTQEGTSLEETCTALSAIETSRSQSLNTTGTSCPLANLQRNRLDILLCLLYIIHP